MKNLKNRTVLFIIIIAFSGILLLSACGRQTETIVAYDPAPTATPMPKDVSERIDLEEKATDAGYTVNIEGEEFTVWNYAETPSISKEDLAKVPGVTIIQSYAENDVKYVPLTDLSTKYDLGKYTDTQKAHDYYAYSESGVWSYARGTTVPVILFNCEEDGGPTVDFIADFFSTLQSNGYSSVFFSDLNNLVNFENPIIIAFANGYSYIYSDVFPLAKQYNVKITVFQTPDYFGAKGFVSASQAEEMTASGLAAFECRIAGNEYLIGHSSETQEKLFSEAKMVVTRSTGRVPCAIAWPDGYCTGDKSGDLADKYYKFGVCVASNGCYNTSDDYRAVKCLSPSSYTSVSGMFELISQAVFERDIKA